MSNRALAGWGVLIGVGALAVCVPVPLCVGWDKVERGYLVAYGLAAAGTFTAAAVALLIASNDARARRHERDEAAEAQARLLVAQPFISDSQPNETRISAAVHNLGTLAILDLVLVKVEVLTANGAASTAHRTTVPAIQANASAEVSRNFPRGSVPQNAEVTVTLQFSDADGNWWEVAFAGPAIDQVRLGNIYSTRRVAFERISAEAARSRLPGGSQWQKILDGPQSSSTQSPPRKTH